MGAPEAGAVADDCLSHDWSVPAELVPRFYLHAHHGLLVPF